MQFYFAYGANLSVEGMHWRCPDAAPICPYTLKDYQLEFSGVATIRPMPGAQVPGALWAITEQCEVALDIFESYPLLYKKEYVLVNNSPVMFYLFDFNKAHPPGKMYLDIVTEGYRDWDLDTTMLDQALMRSYIQQHDETQALIPYF